MDLTNIPRWEQGVPKGKPDWLNSIGCKVKFTYDDLNGEFLIIDYKREGQYFIVEYLGEKFKLSRGELVNCRIRRLLGLRTGDFKVQIGQEFKGDKRDLVIIDKKYREDENNKKWKMYKYKCNKCGFECGEHYKDGEFKEELWISEPNLLKGKGCACCANQVTVTDINSIWRTDPWMMDLGVSEEDAKRYTSGSNQKITVICPDCNNKRIISPNKIKRRRTISCICSEGFSYPERFIYSLLKHLNVDFKMQLSKTTFDWCGKYKYDFYIPKYNMIIETHGLQHYKEMSNKSKFKRTLQEEQENDRIKEQLAKDNDIEHYVVIDCRKSELEWIKNSILKSKLNELFDLCNIDWTGCEEDSNKNIVKEICKAWNEFKEDMTVPSFANLFPEINPATVREYLKKGTKLGWTSYCPKEEMKRSSWNNLKTNRKSVYVYDGNELKHIFNSCLEASIELENIYGTQFHKSTIASKARENKSYKGFIFRYAKINEQNLQESAS